MRFDLFGRARLWNTHGLGQATAKEEPEIITSDMIAGAVPNRLSEVPVWIILSRHFLSIRVFGPDGKVDTDTSFMPQAERMTSPYTKYYFRNWTQQDLAALAAVANDPTEEELQDLALIDGYFAGYGRQLRDVPNCGGMMNPCGPGVEKTTDIMKRICSSTPYGPGANAKYIKNPFFCGTAQKIVIPKTMNMVWNFGWSGGYTDYFGIDPSKPWEEVKPVLLRAIAVMEALKDYPFPPPIDIRPQYWYVSTQADIKKFIRQDIIVTRDLARIWITMAIVNNYEPVSAWIIHDLEKSARRAKRMEVIKAVGMGAAFAIFTAGLGYALAPAIAPLVSAGIPITADAVASGVMAGVQQAISADQKKQIAENMDKIGQLFATDAPRFAEEAYKVRDTFSYLGEAMSELTDEQKAAIEEGKTNKEYSAQEVGEQYDVDPSNWPLQKKLLIGGGIAAGAGVLGVILISILKG